VTCFFFGFSLTMLEVFSLHLSFRGTNPHFRQACKWLVPRH